MSHVATIRAAFEQLRPHIRPEADHLAGTLATAIDQAEAAEFAPPAAAPMVVQAIDLEAMNAAVKPVLVRLNDLADEVVESRAAIRALTESAGL